MRTVTAIALAVPALMTASAALAHDGPHGKEGLPLWLWAVLAVVAAAGAVFGYRALYRAARARDAAEDED